MWMIVKTMIEVKRMAAAGIDEKSIQKELRWCFERSDLTAWRR